MAKTCEYKKDCTNPKDEGCLIGLDYKECIHQVAADTMNNIENLEDESSIPVTWTGNSFGEVDLKSITYTKRPYIIGLVGASNAGKTTLLATLYMLLRSGKKFKDFSFAGSKTLSGWENLAHFLTLEADNHFEFPPHTSRNVGRVPGMLHLRLKDKKGLFHDFLFTDAPGEWFLSWANKSEDENAVGARWINENADAFLLFADSESFKNDLGNARLELNQIAERLMNDISNREIALVWTKYDVEVKDKIRSKIEDKITRSFPNVRKFNTSVIGEGNGELIGNILKIFDWIMQEVVQQSNTPPVLKQSDSTDYFFLIR